MIGARRPSRTRAPAVEGLDAIGNTPLMEIEGVYAKLEDPNPSGSVKARIARYVVEKYTHLCNTEGGGDATK